MTPFETIRGQDAAIDTLRRIVRSGAVGHAYLFVGPRGVGKATVARTWLTGLLCEAGPGDPCGVCGACRRAGAGLHPDLHEIVPQGAGRTIRIDVVRTLCHQLAFPPLEGRHKAVLVDDAHRLGGAAANALLKTLEEPTPSTTFVLVTDRPHALVATIRSRCQVVRFRAVSRADIAAIVQARGSSAEVARVAASLAEGSVGRALELARADIDEERARWLRRAADMRGLSVGERVQAAEEMAASVETMERVLELLRAWYRDAMLVRCGASHAALINVDRIEDIRAVAARHDTEALVEAIGTIEQVLADLRHNVNRRLAAEVLLGRLARLAGRPAAA